MDDEDIVWQLRRHKQELVEALAERTGIDAHCFNAHAKHVHGRGAGVGEMSLTQLEASIADLEAWWQVLASFDGSVTPVLFERLARARG